MLAWLFGIWLLGLVLGAWSEGAGADEGALGCSVSLPGSVWGC